MAFDAHANFGVSSVAVAPSPATTGTSLTVATGEGTRFPVAPFNATLAPAGVLATPANAEIVRVTARSGDVLTITRAQEGTVARAVVVGDLCVASITAKALQDIESGTGFARLDSANTFTQPDQSITASPAPRWVLGDLSQAANQRVFQIRNYNQQLLFQPLADDWGGTGVLPMTVSRSGSLSVSTDLYEKQRTTPLGHWINVPFNAANFTANVGTWTVDAGDVYVQAYTLIGKTLIYSIGVASTSVTGSPAALRVALPSGLVAGNSMYTTCMIWDNGVKIAGTFSIGVGAAYVNAQIDLFAGGTFATATNTTHVFGQISFQLQ
jgi:hypothetical protein